MNILPPSGRPRKSWEELKTVLQEYGVPIDRPVVFGWRGYFRDSMGVVGKNDRAIYDDACFLWDPHPGRRVCYNFNTDPSRYRKGHGTDESTKGMASLIPGVWKYQLGLHKGEYQAMIQAGEVTVMRDGDPNYTDTGFFGINIHRGGEGTTSSLGCQTVPPSQWSDFIMTVKQYMKENGVTRINYVLIDRQG